MSDAENQTADRMKRWETWVDAAARGEDDGELVGVARDMLAELRRLTKAVDAVESLGNRVAFDGMTDAECEALDGLDSQDAYASGLRRAARIMLGEDVSA